MNLASSKAAAGGSLILAVATLVTPVQGQAPPFRQPALPTTYRSQGGSAVESDERAAGGGETALAYRRPTVNLTAAETRQTAPADQWQSSDPFDQERQKQAAAPESAASETNAASARNVAAEQPSVVQPAAVSDNAPPKADIASAAPMVRVAQAPPQQQLHAAGGQPGVPVWYPPQPGRPHVQAPHRPRSILSRAAAFTRQAREQAEARRRAADSTRYAAGPTPDFLQGSQPGQVVVVAPPMPLIGPGHVAYASQQMQLAEPEEVPTPDAQLDPLTPYSEPYIEPTCGCGSPECSGVVCENPLLGMCGYGSCLWGSSCDCGNCGDACGCGDTCECGDACACGEEECHCDLFGIFCDVTQIACLVFPRPCEADLFAGVHAFKGPLDEGRDRGNFGIHEGFNLGGRFAPDCWHNMGYQIGYGLVHSQLHGSDEGNTSDAHTQQFATFGLFRRAPFCGGVQFGAAWDVLKDERHESVDFQQIRTELGWVNNCGREIGLAFTVHTNESDVGNNSLRAMDRYLLYYRARARRGGEARFYIGLDDGNKGILGADALIPLNRCWSLQTGFTYVIPEEDNQGAGAEAEAWNLGTRLVWHWRGRPSHDAPFRPLFDVADNGSLIVK